MKIVLSRWINNWRYIIRDFFSFLGFVWLALEITNYFFTYISRSLKTLNAFLLTLIISILYGVLKNRPKISYIKQIRNKDVKIELKIGNAFENVGALVVPINNEFDLSLGGNVIEAKSMQNQLIINFYDSKTEHLECDISAKIDLNQIPYPVGTAIDVEKKNKKFYLLVNSKKNKTNRVSSDLDDFMMAINGLWDYLSNDTGKDEAVTVPLINTQHGRDPILNRKTAIELIIDTFINSTRYKIVCDKLIISICPSDLEKGEIDFDHLISYLDHTCDNYKDIKFNPKPVGEEATVSKIRSIKS